MKRNKFNAKKTIIDGITFDSKKEAKRYSELKLLEKSGLITDLKLQPKFWLEINGKPVKIRSKYYKNGRRCSYKADFSYINENNELVIEDVKGMDTYASRLVRAVVEAIYDVKINII